MSLRIVRNDITQMNTQAIVNTAAECCVVGPGCDASIYRAAGYDELLAYRKEHVGDVPEGEAFITPGFGLRAKYIIHAVSPLYTGAIGDDDFIRVEEKLRSCYRKSLQLAVENGVESIAFPLIATGSFGYPKEEGMRIAVDEINFFLLSHEMMIYLVVFDERATNLGARLFPGLERYIDQKYVDDSLSKACHSVSSKSVSRRILGNRIPVDSDGKRDKSIFRAKASKSEISSELEDSVECIEAFRPSKEDEYVGSAPSEESDSFEEHEGKLEERMSHLSDTFSEYLLYLIRERHMENAEVYKRAIVDKKTFSKIKNNVDYHPQKLTALCLCVGARLNLDESKDLLARAGYALSPCDKTDIIFSYFIENEIYDMIELDIQLEEHGLPCIIS